MIKPLKEEDNDELGHIAVPAKGKGSVGRPPNKTCVRCGRKQVYPEKLFDIWRYPKALECYNCIMVHERMFNEITRYKPRKGQEILFPLNVLDITNNIVIGEFNDKENTQRAINRYKETKKLVNILVIQFPNYYDFTDCFENTRIKRE